MAKIKVHELAKEIGKSNKDVIDYLKAKGYEVATAVNVVPESEVANVRDHFGASKKDSVGSDSDSAKKAEPAAEPRNNDAPVQDDDDKPKKKGGIIRVFRSENASKQLKSRPKNQKSPSSNEKKPMKQEAPLAKEAPKETSKGRVPDLHAAVEGKESAPKKDASLIPDASKSVKKPEQAPAASDAEKQLQTETSASKNVEKEGQSLKKIETVQTEKEQIQRDTTVKENNQKESASKETTVKETAAPAAKKPEEDTGFRNGRVLRNVNTSPIRFPVSSGPSAQGGRGDRQRTQGDRTRNNQGERRGQGGNGQGTRSDRPFNKGERRGQGGNGQGTRSDRPFNQGERRGQGEGQRGNFQGTRSDRPFGNQNRNGAQGERTQGGMRNQGGQGRSFDRPGQGRPGMGRPGQPGTSPVRGRGPQSARPAMGGDGDGSLAHKTTRDFRKDGKERERNREERKENGKNQGLGGSRKQFNRTPKALQQKTPKAPVEKKVEVVKEIEIPEKITVRDLAEAMKLQPAALIKELFMKGEMVTLNHELTYEKAEEIAMEHDIECKMLEPEDPTVQYTEDTMEDPEDQLEQRPPVICVMGHVDHGKTSLLDAIRNSHVTDREAGGITQHIGAYMVDVKNPETGEYEKLTFLDTPGHEAFTAMRMRGANATDIAVLVVAADDGVMPQTIEAINHAKAAGTEIIVAVNKIDKPGANIDRVMQELNEHGLVPEDWGGETIFCPVSAKKKEGIDQLLEMILLAAEMKELKANPHRNARGIVLEAKLDKGRGPVASILVQKGTLKQGDFIACGAAYGKVRAMTDEKGKHLTKATPSMPVEIIGLSAVPEAGELFVVYNSDKEAKEHASAFVAANKKTLLDETKSQMSLADLFTQIKEGSLKELPIVVKADVHGSVEAVTQSLLKLSNEEVVVKVIHGGVGAITESDVQLAAASNAIIIGFNVKPDATAKMIAENQKVEINLYSVIYEALEDVKRALNGMRAAVYEEQIQGHAEIRAVFKASQIGNIAGSYVKDGTITRSSKIRVFRDEEKIFEGELASLKIVKDDVKEVRKGFECGIVIKDFGNFQVGDIVEAYTMVEVPRK